MIVKAQLSLNDDGQTVLVYTEDRSIFQQFDATPEVVAAIGDDRRAFFYANVLSGYMHLGQRAPEQGW